MGCQIQASVRGKRYSKIMAAMDMNGGPETRTRLGWLKTGAADVGQQPAVDILMETLAVCA